MKVQIYVVLLLNYLLVLTETKIYVENVLQL